MKYNRFTISFNSAYDVFWVQNLFAPFLYIGNFPPMNTQHLTDRQAHLWLIQSQHFSLYSSLSHPDLWNVMIILYKNGIHHVPTSVVQDILYIIQRKIIPSNQQRNISFWQDYRTLLQQLSFIETSNRYLLITHQHRRKIHIYMCMHILSTIALHWPQRFFAYEFSELELEHLKREQEDTIPNMYSMEQYEEDLQQFMSSILSSQKHITTLINKDILSIARHIDVLSEKDQQIAWLSFQHVFEKRLLCAIERQAISFREEEPDSILEHHESQIYPRGGYNSISNRGSIHNILSSQFVYTDIDISSPMNPHHLKEIDCTNENATHDLDVFSLKYLKNELLYLRRDEGFLFRRKRQLIFVFEENPVWLYHSTHLNLSIGIAILALCRTIITSLLQIQDRDSISVDILLSCQSQQETKTCNALDQSFSSDIQFLSLFCQENIALHQHQVKQVEIGSKKTLPEYIPELLRKGQESYVLYFPMNLPIETTQWKNNSPKNLTMIPSFIQNHNTAMEHVDTHIKNKEGNHVADKKERNTENIYQIHDHSDFTALQKLHDFWVFEHLPINSNQSG